MRGPRTAMKSGPRSPQLEKALAQKRRPNTAINKQTNKQTNPKERVDDYLFLWKFGGDVGALKRGQNGHVTQKSRAGFVQTGLLPVT